MKSIITHFWIVLYKDFLLEVRSKEIFISVLIFTILEVLIFNFAFNPTTEIIYIVVPAILWVSITFSGVIIINRTMQLEMQNGMMKALLISSMSRESIFWGKSFATTIYLILIEFMNSLYKGGELILLILLTMFYDLILPLRSVFLISLPCIFGFSLVGTVFSVISVNSRAQEILLPVLFLPVVIPIILCAVSITSNLLLNLPISDSINWLNLVIIFDFLLNYYIFH